MSNFVKQCEQCADFNESVDKAIKQWGYCNEEKIQEWYNFKDVTFFPKVNQIETFTDGSKIHQQAPNRYYCKACIASWDNDAYDDYTYEEWSNLQPINVEVLN